jgi:hypothetical protein
MSLLPGRFIDKEVAKQIKKRQDVIGASERLPLFDEKDPRSYQFFLSKTPFIRLTSGIDKEGLTNPASQAVLDNAFASRRGDVSSIVPGYEFSDDYGVRPAAGIVGMTLKTHNRYGSLRTATVQFEVHSLEQMNLYEEMFMRPGYSALLEWGHTVWLDSDTGEVNDLPQLLSDSFINKSLVTDILKSDPSTKDVGNENKQAIYLAIEEMRRRTNFNYDGMYGLVKNFSWSLRPDGGFSCTVDIVSIGTVIESLDINAGVSVTEKIYFIQLEGGEDLESTDIGKIKYYPGTSIPLEGQIPEISIFGEGELAKRDITPEQEAFFAFLKTDLFPDQLVKRTVNKNLNERIATWFDNLFTDEEFQKEYTKEVDFTAFIPLLSFGKELLGSNIVYNVSTGGVFQFNVATRAEFNSNDLAPLEEQPIYLELNDYSRVIKDATTGISFKYTFRLKEKPEKHTYQQVNIAGPAFLRFWNLQYIVEIEEIPADNDAAGDSDTSTESKAAVEANEVALGQFLRDFAPYYNSRVHLHLHLLKTDLIRQIAPSLTGETPQEVYQEIQFKPDLDKNSKHYRTENFPVLFPQLKSDYSVGAVRRKLGGNTTDSFHHYIQLGTFLDILNLYIPTTKASKEGLFKYHTNISSKHVYKTLEKYHASVDITKCILPDSYGLTGYTGRGDILGIFIEIDYLVSLVEKGLSNGSFKGYDVITEVLKDVNISVGQINELALQYHEDSFTFHIVDRKLVEAPEEKTVALNLIGKNTILRNVTMNSKLSPGISTQIAISAQADPTSNGIEGTLFERFNAGLLDRYISDKKSLLEYEQEGIDQKKQEEVETLSVVFNYLRFVYGPNSFTNQQVSLPGVVNEYRLMTSKLLQKEPKDRSYGGILPFELGLEIEGISGMQVMDSFVINQNILPKSYVGDGNFGFLITGLTHKVDANGWVTEVKSQIYNRPAGNKANASIGALNLYGDEEREFKLVKTEHTPWTGTAPHAERVRKVNESLGGTQKDLFDKYSNYKYDELSSGADIQPFLADTTIAFLNAFKTKFSDKYNVRITGGNDVWHHNHAPASQHTKGRGLDFTIREGNKALGESDQEIKILKDMSNWIDEYFRGNTDVYYKDEYNETRQSNHATGNHFHFHVLKDK